MDQEKAKAKPHEPNQGDVRRRLTEKFPQLRVGGTPFFSRWEFKKMDDEEFSYLCQQAGHIMVSKRTLNYVNERCKQLGIMKENSPGALHIKNMGGQQSK